MASRGLEKARDQGPVITPVQSSGDSALWTGLAVALLAVAIVTGSLSLLPTAARRYDIPQHRGLALVTRHRLELGTLCFGTLATLALIQILA